MHVQQLPRWDALPIETHAFETEEDHNTLLSWHLILPDNSCKQGGIKHIFQDDHQQTSECRQHFPLKHTSASDSQQYP